LRFWNWFEYNASAFHSDSGQVQISVRDESGAFQDWANEGTRVISQSGGWTQKNVDLTTYAGETVRLGFLHRAPIGGRRGWFVDDIEFVTF
jgi:bacillopeptidase F (M6 metalloprotease family)